MTHQHKRLIELSDIKSFNFVCKQCGVSLSVPVAGEMKRGKLYTCPHCDSPWLDRNDTAISAIADLKKSMAAMISVLQGWANRPEGFQFALEIEGDDRASKNEG